MNSRFPSNKLPDIIGYGLDNGENVEMISEPNLFEMDDVVLVDDAARAGDERPARRRRAAAAAGLGFGVGRDHGALVAALVQVVQHRHQFGDARRETGQARQLAAGQHQPADGFGQFHQHAPALVVVLKPKTTTTTKNKRRARQTIRQLGRTGLDSIKVDSFSWKFKYELVNCHVGGSQ